MKNILANIKLDMEDSKEVIIDGKKYKVHKVKEISDHIGNSLVTIFNTYMDLESKVKVLRDKKDRGKCLLKDSIIVNSRLVFYSEVALNETTIFNSNIKGYNDICIDRYKDICIDGYSNIIDSTIICGDASSERTSPISKLSIRGTNLIKSNVNISDKGGLLIQESTIIDSNINIINDVTIMITVVGIRSELLGSVDASYSKCMMLMSKVKSKVDCDTNDGIVFKKESWHKNSDIERVVEKIDSLCARNYCAIK